MRATVSLSDNLFQRAEACARRLGVSRSRLYAKAITDFLQRQDDKTVTERLNDVYSRHAAKLDAALTRAQLKSLPREKW